MQLIPRGLPHMTGERSARMSALIDDLAGAVFDPNSIRCEVTAMVRLRVWADRDSRPARVDPHGDVRHPFWVPLEMIKRARQRGAHVEAFHFTPAIEAAVRLQGQVEKVAHGDCRQQSAGHRVALGDARGGSPVGEQLPGICRALAISGRLEPMLVDAKSPNPGFERLPRKAQPDCCSGGTGHSPLRGCQGGLDAVSLVSWPCAGG